LADKALLIIKRGWEMPIYEFNCSNCKKDFEILVMSQSELINCPHCHSQEVERLMSGFSRAGQADSWDDYGGGAGGYDNLGGGGGCAGCAGGSCATCH
jgi:putative FmdB family regulatory protein